VDRSWSGATENNVDIYRNGVVVATTANDGFYIDSFGGRGHATYTYQVCQAGTQTCSNQATVTF
jgi:serine protease